jgi:hypothetical protein
MFDSGYFQLLFWSTKLTVAGVFEETALVTSNLESLVRSTPGINFYICLIVSPKGPPLKA